MNEPLNRPRPPSPPDVVRLERFPLPPSANALYKNLYNVKNRKGMRVPRAKTNDYILFERMCSGWMMKNPRALHEARQFTLLTGPARFIHMDMIFFMQRERILCKDGRPRKNDTSNRIKALQDVLATILGIDDSYFFSCSCDKVAVDDENKVGVDITMVITPYKDRSCSSPSW